MLILLPPSEGKTPARRGAPLDPRSWPPGSPSRASGCSSALVGCALLAWDAAIAALGLGPTRPTSSPQRATPRAAHRPAERVYSGVLYDALGLTPSTLGPAPGATRVAVVSSLFGLVRPGERIAPYRLCGGITLPGLGGVAAQWRGALDPAVREAPGGGLVVDLRSSTYAAFWRPEADLARRVVTVRVLHEVGGRRQVVSHFNKATKGRLVRDLLEDGRDARTPRAFAALLTDLGWTVEADSAGTGLDVVVSEL